LPTGMDMQGKTFLNQTHIDFGAKMVEFGGWNMPVNYGSQIKEHQAVRESAGMFDVSHMTVVDIKGAAVKPFLRHLLANNIDKLDVPGKGIYSCMLNETAGVIDDLIVYLMADDWSRMVVNAATRDKDLAWLTKCAAQFDVELNHVPGVCMVAVQGPQARKIVASVLSEQFQSISDLTMFQATLIEQWFFARTGYTGEDGFEVIMPEQDVQAFWADLAKNGVQPCGLGARDTLRLEAALNLYGTDMDETISPLECGLAWTVGWEPQDRDFIGRVALEAKRENNSVKFVGVLLEGKGVLRGGQKIFQDDAEVGVLTSGTFSPTLQKSIGLARVDKSASGGCDVQIRNKMVKAQLVKRPFVKQGKALY
jgi:aminomethyltransferase